MTGDGVEVRPRLFARLHLPVDHSSPFLYRKLGGNVGAMNGSIFAFTRKGEALRAYAWWETTEPETIGREHSGLISIVPMHPELWQGSRSGQMLDMTLERLSAQITIPIAEDIP